MQHSKIRTILSAGVAGLVLAILSLGILGLRPAQAQELDQGKVLLVVPGQKVDRIADGDGNNLGPGRVQANIHVYNDGSAKGHGQVILADDHFKFTYEAGTVSYNDAGEVIRITLSGQGEVINTVSRVPFMFTADVDVHSDPDEPIFDILGGNVFDGIHSQAEGTVKVKSGD